MTALLLSALLAAVSPTAEAALSDARADLQRGDDDGAAKNFARAAELVPACGDLEYDTGTAAAQAGQVGAAVLHLERALRESPWDSEARQNLERIRQKRVDKVLGTEPGESPLQRLALGLPFRLLFWLGVLAWWAGFGLLLGRRLSAAAAAGRALPLSLLGVAVLCSGLSWAGSGERGVHYGVVTAGGLQGVKVRSGPAVDLPVTFEVHEGLKLLLLDTENGFTRVRLGNGLEGYVADDEVTAIDPAQPPVG